MVHTYQCDNMNYSESQQRAINEIKDITKHFGKDRWFIQREVPGAGYKTLMALVNKNYLTTKCVNIISYYKIKGESNDD